MKGKTTMQKDFIQEELEEVKQKMNKHDEEISELKQKTAVSVERIDNLCKSLDALCNKIQWQNGFMLTGIVTLVVFILQKALTK